MLKGCLTVLTALAVLSVPPAAFGQEKEFDKTALPNGMTVLTQRCGGDLISACLFIDVGSADESPENNGISKLLAQVLLSCYPLGNASPPPLKVEQLGGRVTVDVRQDFTCYTLVAPAQKFWDALKVLAEALKAPQCVDAAVGQEKTALAAARNRAEDRLEEKGLRTFMRVSYGGMTYGLDPDGSEKGLAAVGRAELVNWHRSYYKPPNMLLSVCGRLVTAQTVKQVEEAFTDWPVISTKKAGTSRHGGEGIRSGTHVEESRSGSAVVMGYTSPRTGSPDYPSMLAVEAMLVDGMGSGVFRALRDKNVLAYNFGGLLPPMRDTSRLVFYVVTDEDKLDGAVREIEDTVRSVSEGNFSEEELQRAKGRAAGGLLMRRETSLGKAWWGGMYEFYGVGAQYGDSCREQVGRLEKADLTKAAQQYLGAPAIVIYRKPGGK
ncbi:MAG TPA: pitrilysin family protein [Nitrospirota bacterium]|nr:pitrilysin family protein [Nitrospirota bacterium]